MSEKVMFVVMDGVGYGVSGVGDAVKEAKTPTLDKILAECPNVALKAHGTAVGLPTDDDMGNSEVGHNALGCGQIYAQGARLVNEAIETGAIYQSDAWKKVIDNVKHTDHGLHFIGLLSDGNVHSNIGHLLSMIRQAKTDGVRKVFIHALLDGRDTLERSAQIYVEQVQQLMNRVNDDSFCCRFASGGGRMKVTMDRYMADWDMVKRGWETHVQGKGRMFPDMLTAITTLREETGAIDQDLPSFVIGTEGQPVGKIVDGDSVVLFNFRGDRAIELSMAFDYETFEYFDRGQRPDVVYAGMLQYDGDLHLPENFLVAPPDITHTLTERLNEYGIREFAVSETQKYGHMTYFWNGNHSKKFNEELETYKEIPSDTVPFNTKPYMKSVEIVDEIEKAAFSGTYEFIRCNFPNGDMVGHTGDYQATILAVEAVDAALARLKEISEKYGYTLVVTADHGNADEMLEKDKKGNVRTRTAHSLNKVPFAICGKGTYELKAGEFGLANVAATIAELLGVEPYPEWEESILE